MWNQRRSLVLSKAFVVLFMIGLAGVLLGAPWIVRWLETFSANVHPDQFGFFLATIYTGGIAGALLLYDLFRLLHNISMGDLFIRRNVRLMRRISWCCFAGAALCVVSALYYLPWLVVGVAASFAGMIVRVVKNLVDEAARLKEENDYTI